MIEVTDMIKNEYFPDGTPIDSWFYDTQVPELQQLGKQYVFTEHGICDDGQVYTEKIQNLIDTAAENGGGVIVVPEGTYLTGALFFRQNVHLYIARGGTLKGSEYITDYPVCQTRIEGESCVYYPALINADGVDGFVMCGEGTVDGSGQRAWEAFWQRRKWNPQCTNKDEQRPRLVFISNSKNVILANLRMQNSPFWNCHIYKCDHVKFLGCTILSPKEPIKAPSTDAIDVDVCSDVLIKNCYVAVDDDAVALKGGKGPWADRQPENGSNHRVIIEDCEYGFCHSCLTCGSESIHNRNILVRRIKVGGATNLLWLKMRPDTPQHYEYITMEEINGEFQNFLLVKPWRQFYDLKDRKDIPMSYSDHVTIRNVKGRCDTYFNVFKEDSQYLLSDFLFENVMLEAKTDGFREDVIRNLTLRNVTVEEISL